MWIHVKFLFFFSKGVVIVWDLSREDDMVLTSSGIGDDSHREPVSKVTWVPDTSSMKKNKYLVWNTVFCVILVEVIFHTTQNIIFFNNFFFQFKKNK